jgi:hypothetical protein
MKSVHLVGLPHVCQHQLSTSVSDSTGNICNGCTVRPTNTRAIELRAQQYCRCVYSCNQIILTNRCTLHFFTKINATDKPILCSVDLASRYICVIKTNLMLHYLSSVYFVNQPLHVSGIFVAHRQEVYCIYTTIGTCCAEKRDVQNYLSLSTYLHIYTL